MQPLRLQWLRARHRLAQQAHREAIAGESEQNAMLAGAPALDGLGAKQRGAQPVECAGGAAALHVTELGDPQFEVQPLGMLSEMLRQCVRVVFRAFGDDHDGPFTTYATYTGPTTGYSARPIDHETFWSLADTTQWDTPWDFHLKKIVAFQKYRAEFVNADSKTPLPSYLEDNILPYRQFTEELDVSGAAIGGRLDWIAGLSVCRLTPENQRTRDRPGGHEEHRHARLHGRGTSCKGPESTVAPGRSGPPGATGSAGYSLIATPLNELMPSCSDVARSVSPP